MSTVETSEAKNENAVVEKKQAKKPAKKRTKKTVKKVVKRVKVKKEKKEKKEGMCGIERDHDLPWNDKKVAIIKALKSLKAFGASSAVSAQDIAKQAKVTNRDVRHYCYHAKVSGLTGVAKTEDVRGYSFHLTAKGAKCDPVAEAKSQK